ncbi:tectonin beta-propeller repeat-containing protein 2 [Pelomyxa schiedti]|nr:tectonin beta-propeller repeat-containing protein 2 [Pelomyxa schiedti]
MTSKATVDATPATAKQPTTSSSASAATAASPAVVSQEITMKLEPVEGIVATLGRRTRYTAVDVTQNLIVMGANTGTISFFSREDSSYIESVTIEEIPERITRIKFAPQSAVQPTPTSSVAASSGVPGVTTVTPGGPKVLPQRVVVAVASQGVIFLVECMFQSLRDKCAHVLTKITLHREGKQPNATVDPEITALEWDKLGEKLFSGDDIGQVIMVPGLNLSKSRTPKVFTGAKVIFRATSRIVQICIDSSGTLVLVSDLTRTCLVEPFEKTERSRQIGKFLREGPYGACFDPSNSTRAILARPSRRLFSAAVETCSVQNTLIFNTVSASPFMLPSISQ